MDFQKLVTLVQVLMLSHIPKVNAGQMTTEQRLLKHILHNHDKLVRVSHILYGPILNLEGLNRLNF